MTSFLLIRHGQTDWNLERRLQGHQGVPLNPEGHKQAEQLANQLAGEHFDALYTSDLLRAVQTAEAVAKPLNLTVIHDPRLREISHGRWESHTISEALFLYPEDISPWSRERMDVTIPGGETVNEVAARVEEFLTEVASLYPQGRVLVISHGFSISLMICLANDLPFKEAYDRVPNNTVPVMIEWPILNFDTRP